LTSGGKGSSPSSPWNLESSKLYRPTFNLSVPLAAQPA